MRNYHIASKNDIADRVFKNMCVLTEEARSWNVLQTLMEIEADDIIYLTAPNDIEN